MATTVIVNFMAADGKKELLAQSLTDIIEIIKAYPSCYDATLFVSQQEPGKMMIIEEWESSIEHQKFYKDLQENGAMDQMSKLFKDFSFNYFEKDGIP